MWVLRIFILFCYITYIYFLKSSLFFLDNNFYPQCSPSNELTAKLQTRNVQCAWRMARGPSFNLPQVELAMVFVFVLAL